MRLISAALLVAAASLPMLTHATSTFPASADAAAPAPASASSSALDDEALVASTTTARDAMATRAREYASKPLSMDDAARLALQNDNPGTADAMSKVVADARRAYIRAVAAEQAARYAGHVEDSADAGAQLASRMRQAGNLSKLDEAREQAFRANAQVQAAKARQQALSAREKLTRTLGLRRGHTQYTLPDQLPDLPKTRPALNDLDAFASRNHLEIRSEVRESYSAYMTSYDVAKHYRDEIVPLRKTISDELLLRYNGMLAGVFELLADAREQAAAMSGYVDSLEDYWLAETDVRQALGGRLPPPASASHSGGQ